MVKAAFKKKGSFHKQIRLKFNETKKKTEKSATFAA